MLASLSHIFLPHCYTNALSIHCLPQCSPQCFPWVMIYMLALLSHMLTSLRYCQCVKFCQIHLHKTMLCLPLDQSLLNQGFHSSPEIGRSPLTSSIYSYEKLQNPLKFENSTEMLDVKKVSYICSYNITCLSLYIKMNNKWSQKSKERKAVHMKWESMIPLSLYSPVVLRRETWLGRTPSCWGECRWSARDSLPPQDYSGNTWSETALVALLQQKLITCEIHFTGISQNKF